MTTKLGQNQYGKAETRVVRVVRDGRTHHIRDLGVSIALRGAMDDVHYSGGNAAVLPTDTAKNTVFAFAREHGIASPEEFGLLLARHFVAGHGPVTSARVRVEEYAWQRIETPQGRPVTGHSFARSGQEVRTAQVTWEGGAAEVVSGLTGLTVLNSTDSEFRGFARDRYTTLQDASDRILATSVNARWRHGWTGDGAGEPPAWDASHAAARAELLAAFAGTYSLSLQQTLYRMGERVIERCPGIDEVRLSLPNKHHILVDLEPFGLDNEHEVYFAADRPYGLIEGTVLRDGAEARIPVD